MFPMDLVLIQLIRQIYSRNWTLLMEIYICIPRMRQLRRFIIVHIPILVVVSQENPTIDSLFFLASRVGYTDGMVVFIIMEGRDIGGKHYESRVR